MNKSIKSQMEKIKEIRSSVLLWELLARKEIEVMMLHKNDNKSVLYLNESGLWSMKRMGHED